MKKGNFLIMFAMILLIFTACKKEDDTGKPGEITISETINGNVVVYTATAENAVKFTWELGNGETPEGEEVTGTYSFPGTYTIKCTAVGRTENTVATKDVVVPEGDPNILNDMNVFLSGYNATTGESETTWVWATGDWNMSAGEYSTEENDSCYFNVIDESWWHSHAGEDADPSVYDDEYVFNLNQEMKYENNFGAEFMFNWMYAAKNLGLSPGIWEDVAYAEYEAPTASWSINHIENSGDLAFTTTINGTDYDGAYIIELTNDAYFTYAAYDHKYQICKYQNDTLLIRYDNRVPEDIANYFDQAELDENGVEAGAKEWDYVRLVKK